MIAHILNSFFTEEHDPNCDYVKEIYFSIPLSLVRIKRTVGVRLTKAGYIVMLDYPKGYLPDTLPKEVVEREKGKDNDAGFWMQYPAFFEYLSDGLDRLYPIVISEYKRGYRLPNEIEK